MTTQLTDEQAKAIGLRVLAWEGFRWMPGMLCADAPDGIADDSVKRCYVNSEWGWFPTGSSGWPDLRDGATRGALLELLREWYGEPGLFVGASRVLYREPEVQWYWRSANKQRLSSDLPTEPEAYAALCEVPRGQL